MNVPLESRTGFIKDEPPDSTHNRALGWYYGTADLNQTTFPSAIESENEVIYRRLGDLELDASGKPKTPTWYTPDYEYIPFDLGDADAPWEGIGTGWFFSVLGGSPDLRPYPKTDQRVEVSFDNTYSARMRGDYAVPTLFNGNFDAIANKIDSQPIPGWSLYNGDNKTVLQRSLVDWNSINTLSDEDKTGIDYNSAQPNYALELKPGDSISHNRFVVPDWGNLRFDVHAPNRSGVLNVKLEVEGVEIPLKKINMAQDAVGIDEENKENVDEIKRTYNRNINSIGFGRKGFETFQIPFQLLSSEDLAKFIGKSARVTFTLEGDENASAFIDNVFFKSAHLKLGNPSNARWDSPQKDATNLLIEKPGYTVSYNTKTKISNWASWQINRSWIVPFGRRTDIQFIADPFLSSNVADPNWPQINGTVFQQPSVGMDRGHLIPDRDRNRNPKDAIETYMGTNLIAQSMDNNRFFTTNPLTGSAWFNIEQRVNDRVKQGQELYIVAGGLGNNWNSQKKTNVPELLNYSPDGVFYPNRGNTNPTRFVNNIHISEWTWKSIIALPQPGADITLETDTFTFLTPNRAEPDNWPYPHPLNQLLGGSPKFIQNPDEWRSPQTWRISIEQLQNLLNDRRNNDSNNDFDFDFDFLSNITDENVRKTLKQKGAYS